jgi:hypothetical protein
MNVIKKRHFFSGLWLISTMGLVFMLFVAGVSHGQLPARTYPDYYPDKFNAIGKIDRIAENEIVINDTLYRLSPNVTCYTPTSKYVSKALFSVGNRVGVEIASKNEVMSLWLLE